MPPRHVCRANILGQRHDVAGTVHWCYCCARLRFFSPSFNELQLKQIFTPHRTLLSSCESHAGDLVAEFNKFEVFALATRGNHSNRLCRDGIN